MSQATRVSPIRIKNCEGVELSTSPARRTDSERALSPLSIDIASVCKPSTARRNDRRRELKRKQAGMPIERQPEAAPTTNVVNLMDALRRSSDAEKPARGRWARRRIGRSRRRGPGKQIDTCLYGRTPYLAVLHAGFGYTLPGHRSSEIVSACRPIVDLIRRSLKVPPMAFKPNYR